MSGERDPERVEASIIVSTRNRAGMLAGCMESILRDPSLVGRELIVVENASSDETNDVLSRFQRDAGSVPVRTLSEPRLGKSFALNSALEVAGGRFLLFTDDDVIVEPGWADALVAPFADPGVGAVGGRIRPKWLSPPPPWLEGAHATVVTLRDWGTEPREFPPTEMPIGANMAVRLAALPIDGVPFDPRFGHRGDAPIGSDENQLMYRIRRTWRLRYAPEAVVWHRITPERVLWPALVRQFFFFGVGEARLLRCAPGAGELPSLRGRIGAFRRGLAGARGGRAWREAPPDPAEAHRRLDSFFRLGYGAELALGGLAMVAEAAEARLAARMLPDKQ